MIAEVLHSGFDGLKMTVQTEIREELRAELTEAKAEAVRTNSETTIERNGMTFAVRRSGGMAFSLHTGEYGAEWYLLDPENRPANNPGVTVDFRAFLLATGGLQAAQVHFEECMAALGIPYANTQLRVSRVDFAVDILAPWFEPNREAIVAPPGMRVKEIAGPPETETHATSSRVTGLRAGSIAGRQLAIYDKRAEVLANGKKGWLTIWNHSRATNSLPLFQLSDPDNSRVWRFELRMGSKQLRNRWEMRSWDDLDAMVGDAFSEFCEKVRYCIISADRNRSRWPEHELWRLVVSVVQRDLRNMRSGVVPHDVKLANREEHKRMLDGQLLGLLNSRAAAEGIEAEEFEMFVRKHTRCLVELGQKHPIPIEERLSKAKAKYSFK
jgi:hypothetical protein